MIIIFNLSSIIYRKLATIGRRAKKSPSWSDFHFPPPPPPSGEFIASLF